MSEAEENKMLADAIRLIIGAETLTEAHAIAWMAFDTLMENAFPLSPQAAEQQQFVHELEESA